MLNKLATLRLKAHDSSMKPLLLILLLAFTASAQTTDWQLIKEMSGEIPDHPGLTMNVYASQIARGDSVVKLQLKAEFPGGAPMDVLKDNAPHGFDISSISTMIFKSEFNCDTLVMKTVNGSGEVYQFNGKKYKTKEPPFKIESGHIFAQYFCEQPASITSTGPPVLKRKP